MRTLFIDCYMGAAGDMLTAALLELFDDPEAMCKELNAMGIPGVEYIAEKTVKMGVTGTRMRVLVKGEEEGAGEEHGHEHEHDHSHEDDHDHAEEHHHNHNHQNHHDHENSHHSHSSMADIEFVINSLKAPEKVRKDALNVYKIIAEAESRVHGTTVSEIHFHEVGTMDAVADVTACCYLLDKLDADRVVVSPVHVGKGTVKCAHGILPVPAPATALILKGVPTYSGNTEGELCTPTGAALLKYFAGSFGDQPLMKIEAIGYGMGKKDFEELNAVRILLGEDAGMTDKIVELEMNLDDMSPERIGFACDRFFELGAVEVYTTPVYMKKSRPGVVLTVMVKEDKRDEMVRAIFKYTTTLGIRENVSKRYALKREIVSVNTPFGEIHKKQSAGYGVVREKYEYDDLASIAHGEGISIDEVIRTLEKNEGTHIEREEEDL